MNATAIEPTLPALRRIVVWTTLGLSGWAGAISLGWLAARLVP